MAIFIALFFQVLFVFFAMAINMGLVVHDKINLQNSVDIAAYYGAMKQGEVLNQIAHINYQMRQNYKLFVWRYRVLGTLGNRNHPLSYLHYLPGAGPYNLQGEVQSWNGTNSPDPTDVVPSVCISHSFFQETVDLDPEAASVCQDNNVSIPPIPPVSAATGFVPGSGNLAPTFQFLATQLARFCKEAGLLNWRFAARILAHFRADGYVRKRMIRKLAGNLMGPDPMDLRNQPIQEGVRKTFERNLTETNRSGIQDFQYFNSLGSGGCAQVDDWLVEIKINPTILFHDWNSNENTGQCNTATLKPTRPGNASLPYAFSDTLFNNVRNNTQQLQDHWEGEPNDDEWHSSVGFEKNPWCAIYTGVQATTAVRKPFDPSGGGVRLVARGFAKPFGGRIGPWYGKSWPQGSPNSMAASRNEMVDPLLPSRNVGGAASAADPFEDVANHSRFPGDTLGMGSRRALSAMVQNFMTVMAHNNNQDTPAIAFANYSSLNGVDLLRQTGDSLARVGSTNTTPNKPAKHRIFELAATSPDVFDALYYSVEPRYHLNYFSASTTDGGAQFNDQEVIFDFGSAKDGHNDSILGPTNPQFSVLQSVQAAANSNRTYMADYEPIVRDWENLLTSWHQRGIVDFSMDPNKFGRCSFAIDNGQSQNTNKPEYPTTGNCIQGGRTGYSVKVISRDFLLSSDHAVGGGATGTSGPIQNPPTF